MKIGGSLLPLTDYSYGDIITDPPQAIGWQSDKPSPALLPYSQPESGDWSLYPRPVSGTSNYPTSKSILRGLCCTSLIFQVCVLPCVSWESRTLPGPEWVLNSSRRRTGGSESVQAGKGAWNVPSQRETTLIFKLETLKSVH